MTGWQWTKHAACIGHDHVFLPLVDLDAARCSTGKRLAQLNKPQRELIATGRSICASCPVATACGEQRDAGNELGMWAGQMRHERSVGQRRTRPMQPAAVVIELRPRTERPTDRRHTNARTRAAEAIG